jgi:Protein of unknown function (DUF3124)
MGTFITMKNMSLLLSVFALAALVSCDRERPEDVHKPGLKSRKGVVEVEPIAGDRIAAGQTLYVPAYSSVFISDQAHRFDLAVTLSVRNTDPNHPVVISSVRYYDEDGQLVRDYLKKPLRIGPMASMEFFVAENDTSGGVSASFLVEWVAEGSVNVPCVESVMIGTSGTQGVSFTCPGRVLADRGRAKAAGERPGG